MITTNRTYLCHWYSIADNQVMVLLKVGVDLGYSNPTRFQIRGPKLQKWMFLLFVHREFIFYLIIVFFVMNSLGKSLSEKLIALLCHYYRNWHKSSPKCVNFKVLTCSFFIQFLYSYFLPNDHLIILMGYWYAIILL